MVIYEKKGRHNGLNDVLPKDDHVLSPRTYGCDLLWKEGLYICNEVKILRYGDHLGLQVWAPNLMTSVLMRDTEQEAM